MIFVFLFLTYFTLHNSSFKKSLHVFTSTEPLLCVCLYVSIESGGGMARVGTLVLFLILEEMFSVFSPLRIMFAVGLSYMAFIRLR